MHSRRVKASHIVGGKLMKSSGDTRRRPSLLSDGTAYESGYDSDGRMSDGSVDGRRSTSKDSAPESDGDGFGDGKRLSVESVGGMSVSVGGNKGRQTLAQM